MNKTLVFDMDGTIADFYGVDNWLECLHEQNPYPYEVAQPLYDMNALTAILRLLKQHGWRVVVTTWLAKDSSKAYDRLVREAKLAWLDKYCFPYDEIHMVKYGTTKANCTRHHGGFQILIDDNDTVRKGWTLGDTIDAKYDFLDRLAGLLAQGD